MVEHRTDRAEVLAGSFILYNLVSLYQRDTTPSKVVIRVNIFQTETTIEIQLVRPTEVCGKEYSEKNSYKSVRTSLLLSNVIEADHQNSCLFTNNGHICHLYGF